LRLRALYVGCNLGSCRFSSTIRSADRQSNVENKPCLEKFGQCGEFGIRSAISYTLVDTAAARRQGPANISFSVLSGDRITAGQALQVGTTKYVINFTLAALGTHILSISLAGRQLPNSPFRLYIFQRTCGQGRVPSETGLCMCDTSSNFDVGGACVAFSILFPAAILPVLAILVCVGFLFCRRHVDADAEALMAEVRRLRARLGLMWKDGFVLSSEWYPVWRRAGTVLVLLAKHIDAAARLSLNREDFEPRLLDGLTVSLQESPIQHHRLCQWLLESVCKPLLDPSDIEGKDLDTNPEDRSGRWAGLRRLRSALSGNSTEWKVTERRTSRGSQAQSASFCVKGSTQENRFSYFKRKVGPLQLWRGEDGALLFQELKSSVVQPCMEVLAKHFHQRYMELQAEEGGDNLSQLVLWEKVCSISALAQARQDDPAVNLK
jgi:hypothetical protein